LCWPRSDSIRPVNGPRAMHLPIHAGSMLIYIDQEPRLFAARHMVVAGLVRLNSTGVAWACWLGRCKSWHGTKDLPFAH
jgi:hypothetical protein